jgi:hypothetical protein
VTALAVAAWAVAVPFFVMPGPLTIESPDIYGGFGLHLRLALGLALAGALLGLTRTTLAPNLRGGRPRPTLDAAMALALVAVIAWMLLAASGHAAQRLLRVSGRSGAIGDLGPALCALGFAGAAVALLRPALDREEGAPLRLLAGGSWLFAGLALLQLLGRSGINPLAVGSGFVVLCGALAAGWDRLRRHPRLSRRSWLLLATAPAALAGGASGTSVGLIAGQAGPGLAALASGLLGAVVAGGVGLQLARRVSRSGPPETPRSLPWAAFTHLMLAGLLVAACFATLDYAQILAESWGFVLEPVQGAQYGPEHPRRIPILAAWAWYLVVVPGGLLADSRRTVLRWLGGTSLVFCAITVDLLLLAGSWRFGPVLAPLGLAVALAWPRLLAAPRARIEFGLLLLAAVVGPIGARYLLSSVFASPPGMAWMLVLGLLVPLSLVPLLLRAGRDAGVGRRQADPVGPGMRAAGVVVTGVLGVMPIYPGVTLGIHPTVTALLALLALAGGAAGHALARRHGWRRPLLAPALALWCFFYACTGILWSFKAGPGADDCAGVVLDGGARVLLDRFAEGGDYLDVQPYDVLPIPGRDLVLTSFKRIDREPGFLEAMALTGPGERARLETRRAAGGAVLWPERMEYDPARGAVITQLLGTEDYAIWDVRVSGSPPALSVAGELPIRWEPGNPALDLVRRRMVLSYVPNRQADNPLVEVFDLDSMTSLGSFSRPGGRLEMADFAAIHGRDGRYYVPAWYDSVRFVLVELEGAAGRVIRQRETAFPSIGLALDEGGGRLFLTSSLAAAVHVLNLEDLATIQVLAAGRFPRDMVLDRQRGRLYVGGYADGVVDAFSVSGARVEPLYRVSVGPLLRGLGLDPRSGRVYAASGCGVFEVAGPEGAPPR